MAGDLQALNTPTVPAVTLLKSSLIGIGQCSLLSNGCPEKLLEKAELQSSVDIADAMTES